MDFYQSQSSSTGDDVDTSRLSSLIGGNIQKIQRNVEKIQRLVGQLGTPSDSDTLRQELHDVQHDTHDLAKSTNSMMKQMMQASSSNDSRTQRLQMDRLRNELIVVLNNFQTAQRKATEKEKASIQRAKANSSTTDQMLFDDEEQTAAGGYGATTEDAFGAPRPKQLTVEQNVDIQGMRERELAIKQLESDIVDVNQIFKDLALMVHEQGEVVDSIEQNIEQTSIHVDQGASEVSQALRYQRSARKKKLLCFMFLAVIIIIVIVILIVEFGDSK